MTPPADPSWRRAGAMDERGREALLEYVLRPPIAQEPPVGDHDARRITQGPEGLVRIALKKRFSDGTFAVDLDPLSLLTRLCASVPPPRFHTVRYAGVLASASPPSGITKRDKLRSRILPEPSKEEAPPKEEDWVENNGGEAERRPRRCRYRPWAELMKRTFAVDVLCCPRCQGRLRLVALMTEPKQTRRYLRALGERTEAPARSPARGPPYWRSRALRRRAGDVDAASQQCSRPGP